MIFSLRERFSGHTGPVYALAEAPNEGGFYSGSGDHCVACWNPAHDKDGQLLIRAADVIYSLLSLAEGERLWVGQASGGIHVIDTSQKREERLLQAHTSGVFEMRKNPRNEHIYSAGGDGILAITDPETYDIHSRLRISAKKIRCIAFHPYDTLALAGCGEGAITTIDLNNLKPAGRFKAHREDHSVNTLQFSTDGKFLLSGSRDAHLNIYEAATLRCIESIPAHNYAIYAIAYSHDGKYFATASRDKTVKIWDAATFEVLQRLEGNEGKGHVNSVNCLLWQRDGSLLSAGDDRTIAIWQTSTSQSV